MTACDKCHVYFPNNKVLRVWNDKKEKGEWLCKSCCIDLAVDAEYVNKFNDKGEVITCM